MPPKKKTSKTSGSRKKVGWGIVGCGVIGPWHATAVKDAPSAKLVAVCDVVKARADALAKEHKCAATYSIEELLKHDDIQAVSVCTPSGMHAANTIQAAEAGKHVLCEKPLDIKMAAMDAMIAACEEAGVKLAAVFQMRTREDNRRVREAVRGGKLGKLVLADMYQKYHRDHEYYASGDWRATWALDGGGALMNQGVHGTDLLLWVVGDVARVSAYARRLVRNIEVDDTVVANLEFVNGALGNIVTTTSVTPGYGAKLEIHGDCGSIRTEGDNIIDWSVPGEEMETSEAGDKGAAADPQALSVSAHTQFVENLAGVILNGGEPDIPGRDAIQAVKLIRAIYLSSREGGAPVELNAVSNEELDEDGIYPIPYPPVW